MVPTAITRRPAARHLDRTGDGNPREEDLLERYRFHVALQALLRGMLGEQARVQSVLNFLSGNTQLDEASFNQVRDALGVTRPTAQAAIDTLVERGDLVEVTGRERGRVYHAPGISDAVYGDVATTDESRTVGYDA